MSFIYDRLPGNGGIIPRQITCHLAPVGAVVKGTCYTVDMTFDPSASEGVCLATATVSDGAVEGQQWVMAMEAAAAGVLTEFLIQGYVDYAVAGATTTAGAPLASDGAGALIDAIAGDVIIAITPDGGATPNAVWFCGGGLGTLHV